MSCDCGTPGGVCVCDYGMTLDPGYANESSQLAGVITAEPGFYYPAATLVTIDPADNEQSIVLPVNVRNVQIENLTNASIRLAWLTGMVADPTATDADNFVVGGKQIWNSGQIYLAAAATLYYASSQKGAQFNLSIAYGF